MEHREVQQIAKSTIEFLKCQIRVGMTLKELRRLAEDKMFSLGATSFWYWDVGAFVFSGEETTLSVSGKNYLTSDRLIEKNDIITIDLSPQVGSVWGDYARTIIIENGEVVRNIDNICNRGWKQGLSVEEGLHGKLLKIVTPETTFEELYFYMNDLIVKYGYKNLDFMGNLGHSIAEKKEDRIYIEKGNRVPIKSVNYFTFEPHIALTGGKYGYKHENIYYFKDGQLKEL